MKHHVSRLAGLAALAAVALLAVGSQAGAGAPLHRYIIQLSDSPLASLFVRSRYCEFLLSRTWYSKLPLAAVW